MIKMSKPFLEFIFVLAVAVLIYSFNLGLLGNLFLLSYFAYKVYSMRYFVYSIKGNKLYSQRNTEEALKWFKKAAEVRTCRPRVISGYGYLLLREGRVEEASKVIGKVLKMNLDPMEKSNTKMTLALIHWKNNDLQGAIDILEEIYNTYKSVTLYESLGYLLILTGDYDKALKFNLEAQDYDSSNNIILDNLGETYYFLGEKDKAFNIYKDLVEKPITFAEPFYFYGLILSERDRKEEAKEMFEKALSCRESFLSNLNKDKISQELDKLSNEIND
ncbi:tetratricopeptide repeat protein [Desnuesiella massiliensis]|uniref:tetratricopeptide repeat protein n=1 Tax=Desnuesiella massiliensis TaxID=1650662 RepID=UPI0006E40A47|nr:tetratricopeptide repeat protein [Desnuesiella massiliensis]